jgi:hypothetical protein
MILSTCSYVKKNAGLSFDVLHSVVGVAKVGASALPANRAAGFLRMSVRGAAVFLYLPDLSLGA